MAVFDQGGAAPLVPASHTFAGLVLQGNSATQGGGLYMWEPNATVTDSVTDNPEHS